MSYIKLGFVGSYKGDIFHYFSRILLVLGKKVVVVDASKEQDLQFTLPNCEGSTVVTSLGIDYLLHQDKMELLDQLSYSEYDIALIDYGFNNEVAYDYSSCHILFLVTDFQKHHVMKLKELVATSFSQELNVVKLYRDVVSSKIRSAYVNRVLGVEDKTKVLAEYIFELNEADYQCKLLSQYEELFRFSKLSKAYKGLFIDILDELFNLKKSQVARAIKRAEGGRICK